MTQEQTTPSAELTRIEAWLRRGTALDYVPWWDVVAWMKNREATEALLLGMLEKLTPAAQETTPCEGEPSCPACIVAGQCLDPRSDPLATPQPVCEHRWQLNEWLSGKAGETPLRSCVANDWCPAIMLGNLVYLPQPLAPQRTEG